MHLDLEGDTNREFPRVTGASEIRSARIWNCKFASLAALSQLSNLETLVVFSYPDDSFRPLATLARLKYLAIIHLPKVGDIEPLAALSGLETLSLATLPSWDSSGKVQKITSLASLAALPSLRHLELFGVVPEDRSLVPLHDCRHLKSARFSKFPLKEVKRFYETTGVSNAFNPRPPAPAA